MRVAEESAAAYAESQEWRAEESHRRDSSASQLASAPAPREQFARFEKRGICALEEREAAALADSQPCEHNAKAATGARAAIGRNPPDAIAATPVAGSPGAHPPETGRSLDQARGDREALGSFSRGRRRELWSRLRHWQTLILHPQRIYPALRELRARPGGEEALGRFERLLAARKWHPTDQHAIRRFVALMFGLDTAKPYNWGPRAARKRRGLARFADVAGAHTWGYSMRGIGQAFLGRLFAAGDGEPIDRSTTREIYADLASVGLCAVHQPPLRAKLAPFERGPNGGPFNQYWFAMAGQLRKPAMRGELDHVSSWTAAIDAWFARLLRPSSTPPPLPAS